MLEHAADWAANNPTTAWAIFIGAFVLVIIAIAAYPRRLPPLDDTDNAGC